MVCGIWQKPKDSGNVVLTGVSIPADSTGTHSLYTTYQDYEIMFHVSTLLPYTPNNRQQVSGFWLAHTWPQVHSLPWPSAGTCRIALNIFL